ncbi:helix-turn-helix transcriptional regulator [Kitasatospora sp. NPDC096147]|uniref:helix-turn-helix domain-containing protein n=1 Tax=Kitasatospora sp. NPDC096147 TaxID=3364093 RepID=UPI003830094A
MAAHSLGFEGDDNVFPLEPPDEDSAGAAAIVAEWVLDRRLELKLEAKQVATAAETSPSTYSRIETGRGRVHPKTVARVLDVLGFKHGPDRQVFMELVKEAAGKGWLTSFHDAAPGFIRRYYSMESRAYLLRTLETRVVPGLLQTPEYARAISSHTLPADGVGMSGRIVELRMERQRRFFAGERAEAAFFFPLSVFDPEIGPRRMIAAQIEHVIGLAETPGVMVRIIPPRLPVGLTVTAITLLEYKTGSKSNELIYEDHGDVGQYYMPRARTRSLFENRRAMMELVWSVAMEFDASLDALRAKLEEYRD